MHLAIVQEKQFNFGVCDPGNLCSMHQSLDRLEIALLITQQVHHGSMVASTTSGGLYNRRCLVWTNVDFRKFLNSKVNGGRDSCYLTSQIPLVACRLFHFFLNQEQFENLTSFFRHLSKAPILSQFGLQFYLFIYFVIILS